VDENAGNVLLYQDENIENMLKNVRFGGVFALFSVFFER